MRRRPRTLAVVALAAVLATGCRGADATDPAGTPDTAAGTATPAPTASATPPAEPSATGTDPATTAPDGDGDVVAVFDEVPDLHPSIDDWDAGVVEVVAGDGTVHRLPVRVAATADERAHGLMEVPELPDGTGMWFAYGEDRTGAFWMKDTLVPLDITYVGGDDRIVSVSDAVPCEADPCPTYPPSGTYHDVLEVPGGYLDRIGAGVGDVVRLVEG